MNAKPKTGALLVLASQGQWETILQMLQTTAFSRFIPEVAEAFEARGDERGAIDRADAVSYLQIAFWCRWVLVERSKSLDQRAERGADMMRMKEKLDAAMALEDATPRADPV